MNYLKQSIKEGKRVCKKVHKGRIPNLRKAKKIIKQVEFLFENSTQEVIFEKKELKIIINQDGHLIFLDFDYDYDDVFITYQTNEGYKVRDTFLPFIDKESWQNGLEYIR